MSSQIEKSFNFVNSQQPIEFIMNKLNVCRLCAIKTDDYLEIFKENGRKLRIAEIITQHFWFEIPEPTNINDLLQIVCKQCWTRLLDFHHFYTDIEVVQGRGRLDYIKVEIEPQSHSLDIFSDNVNALNECNWVELNIEPIRNETEIKCTKRKVEKECKEEMISKRRSSKTKEERDYDKEKQNEYYRTFFNMDCELCEEKCNNFDQIRHHYQTIHNERGYVRCCTRKFTSLRAMKLHIIEHVEPNSLKCDYCQKTFTLKKRLRDHVLTHIEPENRQFKCDKCERRFVKQCQLTDHYKLKHATDSEKIYQCDLCDKRYVLQYLLTNHKSHAHQPKGSFICDVCAREFSSYSNYMTHKKLFHDNVMTPIQCQVCGKWLKNRSCLKGHMIIHIDGDEKTCEHCFKVLKNRRSLRKHCKEVHTAQPLFKCKICTKEYRREINLKEHMSSHTGATLYSCSFCTKTFNASANMYKHRKTVHPIEYQLSKDQPNSGILKNAALLSCNNP